MEAVFPLFDYATFFVALFTEKAGETTADLVANNPERLIALIENQYEAYTQAALASGPSESTNHEGWMHRFVEEQINQFPTETQVREFPTAAREWLDELPALLQRRQSDGSPTNHLTVDL